MNRCRASYYLVALAAASTTAACGASPAQPHSEVSTRQQIPIPVCTTPLVPVARKMAGKAVVRQLEPEEWAGVISPYFRPENGLGPTDADCTGHYLFANESLRGGISATGWPRTLDSDDLDVRAGPEGMRVVWLHVLKFANGDIGGPMALVRAADDRAEVFAVGSFRAPPRSKASPVRLGNETLVVAESTYCPDLDDCRKRADFFLAQRGRLLDSAQIDLERVQVIPSISERGLYARYVLKTDVTYKPDGIHLLEQVKVRIVHYDAGDRDSDRDLRSVEFSRFLRVDRDALFSSNDPLWERVIGQD